MSLGAVPIIERMKFAAEMKSDSELARLLGVTPQAIYKFRKQEKLPADLVVSFAIDAGLSLDWLVYGIGTMMVEDIEKVFGKVDEEVLEAVIDVIEDVLKSMDKMPTPKQKTQLILALYDLAVKNEARTVDRPTALRLVKLMGA